MARLTCKQVQDAITNYCGWYKDETVTIASTSSKKGYRLHFLGEESEIYKLSDFDIYGWCGLALEFKRKFIAKDKQTSSEPSPQEEPEVHSAIDFKYAIERFISVYGDSVILYDENGVAHSVIEWKTLSKKFEQTDCDYTDQGIFSLDYGLLLGINPPTDKSQKVPEVEEKSETSYGTALTRFIAAYGGETILSNRNQEKNTAREWLEREDSLKTPTMGEYDYSAYGLFCLGDGTDRSLVLVREDPIKIDHKTDSRKERRKRKKFYSNVGSAPKLSDSRNAPSRPLGLGLLNNMRLLG